MSYLKNKTSISWGEKGMNIHLNVVKNEDLDILASSFTHLLSMTFSYFPLEVSQMLLKLGLVTKMFKSQKLLALKSGTIANIL